MYKRLAYKGLAWLRGACGYSAWSKTWTEISALQFSDSFTANIPSYVRLFSWFTGRKISLIVAVNHSWTLYELPSMIAFYNSLDQLSSTSTELVDRRIFSLFKE